MKKLVYVLLAVLLMATQSQAQVYTLPLAAGDTVVDAGTAAKIFNMSGDYKGIVVEPGFTKNTGTVAGTIKLQASVKGVVYVDVASQTFTATNVASNSTLWYVSAPLARYYKVTWTGTGTMQGVLNVSYRVNK